MIFNNYPGISSAKLLQKSAFPAEMYPPATSMIIINNYPGISSARLLQNSALPADMYRTGYQYDDNFKQLPGNFQCQIATELRFACRDVPIGYQYIDNFK